MQFQPKRKLLLGAVVLAACSFGGGAYAATQDSSSSSPQAFLNDVAKRLGVSTQQLTAAFDGAMTDQLNAAVKAGELTQSQANALEQRFRKHLVAPFGLFGPGARGFLGPGHGGGLFHFRLAGPGAILSPAAKYLGISTAELQSELRSGKTLRQIAKQHGKSVAGLQRAIQQAIRSARPSIHGPRLGYGPPSGSVRPGFGGPPPAGFGPHGPLRPAAAS